MSPLVIACLAAGPSYGNNFNNRIEEAVGNAHDFWRAYKEGAFKTQMKPFLGYLMLLEHDDASTRPVAVSEPHYEVLPEFRNASYAKRYEIFCEKAFREGLYDATAFLMSNQIGGLKGEYIEPSAELSFKKLAAAIYGRAVAHLKQDAGYEWLSDKYSVLDPYALVFYAWGVKRELPVRELKHYAALKDRMEKRAAVQRVIADEGVKL